MKFEGNLDLAAGHADTYVGGFFRNNSNTPGKTDIPNWLGVRLEGVQANASAIGAVITLHYPGGIQTRQVVSGRGSVSGDSLTQYFGLVAFVDGGAVFDEGEIKSIVAPPFAELTLTGEFITGEEFAGTDLVTVTRFSGK